jgi:transposase InsO family protein
VFVFNPVGTKKASTDRLSRWADLITSFRFVVEHIPGSYNIWADILSRWQTKQCPKPVFASMNLSTPTTLSEFEWPTILEICEAQKSQPNIPPGVEFSEELFRKDGRVWVPTHDLQTRIMIIAHCASSGHRGGETTANIILEKFWWQSIREDTRQFVMNCLHCTVNAGQVVPRPLAEQIHASERNEIVHYDFMYINKRNPDYSYVLVIKDDLTNFVRLIPAKSCDHIAVAEALLNWYSDFGIPKIHISDQGSHFKNSVIRELHRLMGSKAHYTVAYSPWSNGTVEIVNKSILNCLRSLISEFQSNLSDWPQLIPLVQGVLNHSPSRRLAGMTPVTLFTGLPPNDPLNIIYDKRQQKFRIARLSDTELIRMHEELSQALQDMHKAVMPVKQDLRNQRRKSRNDRLKTQQVNFDEGDFVLVATVNPRDKLEARWKGPYRITKIVNDLVFEVEDLLSKSKKEVHASRLRIYKDREIDVKVKEHLQFHNRMFEVYKILDQRTNEGRKEVLVQWRGFEAAEATWEPLESIMEDVPQLYQEFVDFCI